MEVLRTTNCKLPFSADTDQINELMKFRKRMKTSTSERRAHSAQIRVIGMATFVVLE